MTVAVEGWDCMTVAVKDTATADMLKELGRMVDSPLVVMIWIREGGGLARWLARWFSVSLGLGVGWLCALRRSIIVIGC